MRCGLLARVLAAEPLRVGTRELFGHLRREGFEIWVYTSSQRSVWAVRLQFALYGLWIDGVVNEQIHREAEEKSGTRWPLKYPPGFGIDLLVDNSVMVLRAAQKRVFSVVHVSPKEIAWTERVRAGIERRGAW